MLVDAGEEALSHFEPGTAQAMGGSDLFVRGSIQTAAEANWFSIEVPAHLRLPGLTSTVVRKKKSQSAQL